MAGVRKHLLLPLQCFIQYPGRWYLVAFLLLPAATGQSQITLSIPLPDIRITADQLVQGDADTYGRGSWVCTVQAVPDSTGILLSGSIRFQENEPDYTVIAGSFSRHIQVPEMNQYRHCIQAIGRQSGRVSGPNIGARGYRSFRGTGLIRKAHVRTDTFGPDTGRIGGTLYLRPVILRVHCDMAGF